MLIRISGEGGEFSSGEFDLRMNECLEVGRCKKIDPKLESAGPRFFKISNLMKRNALST